MQDYLINFEIRCIFMSSILHFPANVVSFLLQIFINEEEQKT